MCDEGFVHSEDRDACRTVARGGGAAVYLVEFTAPLDVIQVGNRARWGREGILVDGTQDEAFHCGAILAYLETGGVVNA